MLARLRSLDDSDRRWLLAAGAAIVVAIPLVLAGPGNDLDVANVFRSGRAIVRHADYVPSRPPGAPVHEAIVGVADLVGGPLLATALSVLAAAAAIVVLHHLVRDEAPGPGGRWAVALVAVNPWFVIAATSAADYVFALGFGLGAALALRRDRWVLAGLLAAGAMGCRVGTATLLLAAAVATLAEGRDRRAPVAKAAGLAVVGTALAYLPSVLDAGGLDFARNDFATSSIAVQVGRFLAKDLLLVGLPAAIALAIGLPAVVAVLRDWSTSWAVRFGLVGLVGSQLLFLRFPWKMAHLLPSLACLAVLYAVALDRRPRVLVAAVVLQLLFAVVRVDVVRPDDPNEATGGRLGPTVTWGPVVQDWRCRRDHPDVEVGRQKEEVEAAWDCAAPFSDRA